MLEGLEKDSLFRCYRFTVGGTQPPVRVSALKYQRIIWVNHFGTIITTMESKQALVHFQSLPDCSLVCRTHNFPPDTAREKETQQGYKRQLHQILSKPQLQTFLTHHSNSSMISWVYQLCTCPGSQPLKAPHLDQASMYVTTCNP